MVFADADDLDRAAAVAAGGIFRDSGQVCVAGSCLLVEWSIRAKFVERVMAHGDAMRVGDPQDLHTNAGAIASETQMNNIRRDCEKGNRPGNGNDKSPHAIGKFRNLRTA